MRIAILSCFYPYRGGISQFNTFLFKELSKEHTVAAFNFKRQYPNFLFPGKTQYITKEDKAVSIESEALLDTANPFSYISTAKKIAKWKPDLLIMRYWMSYFGPSLGTVAKIVGKDCKVISIVDNVIPHEQRFFDRPFTSYFVKNCDGFVALCDAVKQDLLDFKSSAKCIVSPHPLYTHFGEKLPKTAAEEILNIEKGKKNILFFGLIREYKGLDILINAFSLLDDSYQLIIAGEPYGAFDKYQALIDASPNKERINFFNGYIPDNEVTPFFSASDVCVLPYRSATQSGVSAITYHFETPLITTNVGGLKETIGDKGAGIIVDNITPEAIKDGIVRYFSDRKLQDYIIESIKKEKQRLSWSNFCSNLTELYKKL